MTKCRLRFLAAPVALLVGGMAVLPAQALSVLDLLRAAGAYVVQYEAGFATMLFEEQMTQSLRRMGVGPTPGANFVERRLRAEVAIVNSVDLGWIGFRDVFEVDGAPVHDRQQRLQELFLSPSSESLARAGTIAGEGSRFNLGRLRRNLSYPTMALLFLRQEHQSRSTFVREDSTRVDGRTTSILRFRETARPSLVRDGSNDAIAAGRFWIEPDSGRIRRSQVTFDAERTSATITVDYGVTPAMDLLVPLALEEEYMVRLGDTLPLRPSEIITGRARYSNFRQFKATARIKAP
jgi:hypothetical protein